MKSNKYFFTIFILFIVSFNIVAQETGSNAFQGPFFKIFQETKECVLIKPTNAPDTTKSSLFNPIIDRLSKIIPNSQVVTDSQAINMDSSNQNVFTIGNQDNNIWIKNNLHYFPFQVLDTQIITDTSYNGTDMLLTSCMPNPGNNSKAWFFMLGQTNKSYNCLETADPGFVQSDWAVLDTNGAIASGNYLKNEDRWKFPAFKDVDYSDSARWIWYPGDFEVFLNKKTSLLRKERNQIYPPLWRVDAPYGKVLFSKTVTVNRPEIISIYADGDFTLMINNNRIYDFDPEKVQIPRGTHNLQIEVVNYKTLPSLLIKGKTVITDTTWNASFGWRFKQNTPGIWTFNKPDKPPGEFSLEEKEIEPLNLQRNDTSVFADFGQETFGRLLLKDIKGNGKILIVYGESKEEALAGKIAETWETRSIDFMSPGNDTLPVPMAFRYVSVQPDSGISIGNVSHLYEYLPVKKKGTFECSDTLLNQIFKASSRTLELNTRELMTDGIKRDRWCWSGDVFIGLPLNYYHYFDEDIVRRSLIALRGHDPVIHHINTIPEYTFYWFINIYNHFLYTADTSFIYANFDNMKSMMDYCLEKTNDDGFFDVDWNVDWVFIDWSKIRPGYGIISLEQVLFWKSLTSMAEMANIIDEKEEAAIYDSLAFRLKPQIKETLWNDSLNGFVYHVVDTVKEKDKIELSPYNPSLVTRYANYYALLMDMLDEREKSLVKKHVLLNDSIPEVKAPFHRYFEWSALCEMNEHEYAVNKMREYCKGMLELGATTFWEDFTSSLVGVNHYKWSGRPYGKSLCHLWGAGPILIIGKYIAGIRPLEPGYKSYLIEPNLSGLDWFDASVPVKHGFVKVYMDKNTIKLKADMPNGICRFKSSKKPKSSVGEIVKVDKNLYEIVLTDNIEYQITYKTM